MCPEIELLSHLVDRELDAEIEREVAQHLVSCASCRARVASLRSLHRMLSGIKHASDSGPRCPESMSLAAYLTEASSPSERESLESHLSQCETCLHELAFLSEDMPDSATWERTAFDPMKARSIAERMRSSQTKIITFNTNLRWMAAAAMLVIAVGVAVVAWPRREPTPIAKEQALSTPQSVALLPDYAEGTEEAVQVNYAEHWVPVSMPVNRPAVGVSEKYSQRVTKARGGYPVELQRSYTASQGPYGYFNGKTMTVRRSPEMGRTQIWCSDFEREQPWQNEWWSLPPTGFDDHFLFALPSQPVRVGESWAVTDKANLRNALMKYAQCSVGQVGDVRAMGTLKEVTKDGQAVIDLKMTFQSSQIRGERAAMHGTLYFDMAKHRMVRSVLQSDPVALQSYRFPGGEPLPVNDPIALDLNITYKSMR